MSNNSRSPHGSGKDGKSGSNAGSNTSGTSFSSFRGKSDPIHFGASAFMGKKNSEPHGSQDGSSPSFSPISPASDVPPEFLPPKHRSTQTSMPASAHKATQVPSSASTVSSLDTTSTVMEGLRTLPRFGAEDAQSVGSGAATSDVPGIAVTKASSEAGSTTRDANIEPPASSSPAGVRSPSVQSSLSGSLKRPDGVSSPRSGSTISGNKKSTSPTPRVRSPVPAPTPPGSSVASHHSSTSASRGQPRSPVPAPTPPGSSVASQHSSTSASRGQPRSPVPAPSPPGSSVTSHYSSTSANRGQPRSPAESIGSPVPAPTPPGNKPSSDASHHIGASRDQTRSSAGPDAGLAGSASRSVHGDEDAHSEQEPKSKGKGKAKDSARRRSRGSKERQRRLITKDIRTKERTKTRTWEFDPRTGQIDTTSDGDVQRDHKRELEPKRKEGEERNHGHETEKTSSRRSSTSWGFKAGPNRRMSVTQTESTKDTTEYKRSR